VPPEKRGFAFGFNRAADHLGAVLGPICAFLLLSYFASDPQKSDGARLPAGFSFPASIPLF
jgi:MFS family permease